MQAGAYDQAEQMNQASLDMAGPTAEYYAIAGLLALVRGQRAAAEKLASEAVALDANNPVVKELIARLSGLMR
jgi:Flp pilus assembly protein TadD